MITHPEKVLFPAEGEHPAITKGELAAYYESIADVIVPHIRARPITMERYPSGIGKKGFIQKDVSKGFPSWLERVEAPKKDGVVHHPLVTDTRSLLWIVNQNTITPHVWSARAPDLYSPDICVFDLDPSIDDAESLRAAALGLRELLEKLGLPSWVKTSGSKGFHIVVPLDGSANTGEVARFAHTVGRVLVDLAPDHLTQEFSKADRGTRILIDTGRNDYSATWAAPYATRAKPGAPVSAPCTWEEVERGTVGPRTFTLLSMPSRLAEVGDLWSDMRRRGRSLRKAIAGNREDANELTLAPTCQAGSAGARARERVVRSASTTILPTTSLPFALRWVRSTCPFSSRGLKSAQTSSPALSASARLMACRSISGTFFSFASARTTSTYAVCVVRIVPSSL